MKVTKDLTEGNIYKNFLLYALPLIVSALLSSAYSTVDAMIAGKCISEYALGAISATDSYHMIFSALFIGFAAGFSVYVALLFGKKDFAELKQNVVQMMMLLGCVTVLISVGSILLCEPILDYLRVDPLLRDDAKTYFIIYASGYIATYLNYILIQILHALGITSFSLYVSFASAVLNIGGNLLTVLVLDWGVAGLAVSTLLSTAGATVFYLYMLRRAFRELPSERIAYRFSFSCFKKSMRYTLPAAVQQLAYHGIGVLIAPTVNGLGADATTANTVANRIFNICAQSYWSTSTALGCHTAQCVGAGKLHKIGRGLGINLLMCCCFLAPFMIVFVGFPEPMTSLFFPGEYTGEAFRYAVRFVSFYLSFAAINMLGHLIHTYLRGLGVMTVVLWLSVLNSVVQWIATLCLVPVMGTEGVFLARLLAWIADTVASVVIWLVHYRTEHHIRRTVEKVQRKKTATATY